ncbi:MAG: response regulator [Elusimicrobiota bacterium]
MVQENILVVDDEKSIQAICSRILKREGHAVDCANNGKEALDLLQVKQYKLIISDLKMPEMDGRELLKAVKEKYPQIIFMFITAYATTETAEELLKNGANEYLFKPFNIEDFIAKVRKCLS